MLFILSMQWHYTSNCFHLLQISKPTYLAGRQSGLKTWGVLRSALKTGVSWVLKINRTEVPRAGLRISSPELIICKFLISEKSPILLSVFLSNSCTLWDMIIFHVDPTIMTPQPSRTDVYA